MADPVDIEAFLTHVAERFEAYAREARLDPKRADLWLSKASGTHAVMREMRRLQRIERLARHVIAIFDERDDVLRLRYRVADGHVDHRDHFLKLRVALQVEATETEKAKGGA